jgi:hypothetical protein
MAYNNTFNAHWLKIIEKWMVVLYSLNFIWFICTIHKFWVDVEVNFKANFS